VSILTKLGGAFGVRSDNESVSRLELDLLSLNIASFYEPIVAVRPLFVKHTFLIGVPLSKVASAV
jgi:hypothetical protein